MSILRIIGSLENLYQNLIIRGIELETIHSPHEGNDANQEGSIIYNCLGAQNFFTLYDNEHNYSKKKIYRRIITWEINAIIDKNLSLDTGNFYEYLVRSDTLFDAVSGYEFLKTATIDEVSLFYEVYIEKSPEGYLFCKVTDLGDETFISIFDNSHFQFDQIDLVTDKHKFRDLTDPGRSNNAVVVFNGSFFKELHSNKSSGTPSAGYATGFLPAVKGVPVGNYVFRSPRKIWNPKKEKKIGAPDYSQYPKIGFNTIEYWSIYPTNESRFYFAQKTDGAIITGKTVDNKTWFTGNDIATGCDNLVAFRLGSQDVSDLDTQRLITDETNLPSYHPLQSPDDGYKRGFPFFGKLQKNGKEYFFSFIAEDCSKHLGLQTAVNFLKSLGATDILFSDGASSTGLIFKNNLLVEPQEFKDQLITTAISIKKNELEFKDVLSRLQSKIEQGGEFNVINNYITGFAGQLSSSQINDLLQVVTIQRPLPDFSGMHVRSHFGNRPDVNGSGAITFHAGVDIDMNEGTNVFPVLAGKVHAQNFNNGWGNYIIIFHGKDTLGNKYYTLYAHSNELMVANDVLVTKQTVIARSGATGHVTGPHLHLEVRVIPAGSTENVLSKKIVRDPENIIFPKELTID